MIPAPLALATVFAGGLLLLAVEPMVARMVLPDLGGSSMAWTTTLAFFQSIVLLGSAWAHFSARLGRRRQALLHAALVLLSLAWLPLAVDVGSTTADPSLALLATLAARVAIPAVVLCATSSLVQQWLAGGESASRVFAASNAGSLVGVLGYPVVVEPLAGLRDQAAAWSVGYAAFSLFMLALVVHAARSGSLPTTLTPAEDAPARGAPWRWAAWAFVPCSLLMGVTAHLGNEIPSFPLAWVVPLALYLLSFIVPFARWPGRWLDVALSVEAVVIGLLAVMMFVPVRLPGFSVHLAAIFVVSLLLHGRLARDAPPPSHRGGYVLSIAAGGAAAGLFNAVIAPRFFPVVLELPLAVVAACLLRPAPPPGRHDRRAAILDIVVPGVLFAFTLSVLSALPHANDARDVIARQAVLLVAGGMAVTFRRRPLRLALGMATVLAGGLWAHQVEGTLHVARSPYGVSRVVREPRTGRHLLFHGTTIHGASEWEPGRPRRPLFYHHEDGAMGRMMTTEVGRRPGLRWAVIGLGAGSLAHYAQPGQRLTFLEIDPVVVDIARDPRWFTFLPECRAEVDVVLGDGRVSMAAQPAGAFDLVVVDAFSSDGLPVHLLTREAVQVYLSRLAPGGVLVFDTSNRHLDVQAVVVALADSLGLPARVTAAGGRDELGTWAILARHADDLAPWVSTDARFVVPGAPAIAPWTDDRASILDVLRW